MKIFLMLGFVALLTVPASAIHPAQDEDQQSIQSLINQANDFGPALAQAIQDENTAKLACPEGACSDSVRRSLVEATRTRESVERQRNVLRDKAVHRTLIAYGIVPVSADDRPEMPSGSSVMPGFVNKTVSWKPVAADNGSYHEILANGGVRLFRPISVPVDSGLGGRSFYDGATLIFDFAFQYPDLLAVVLAHEKHHFDQYVAPGHGNKMSFNEREVDAWNQTAEDARAVDLDERHPEGKWAARIEASIAGYQKGVSEERAVGARIKRALRPSEDANLSVLDSSERVGIDSRFDDLSATVANEIRRERAAALALKNDEKLAAAVEDISDRICLDFNSVSEDEVAALATPSNPNFYVGRQIADVGGDCARKVFNRIGSDLRDFGETHLSSLKILVDPASAIPLARAPSPTDSDQQDEKKWRAEMVVFLQEHMEMMRQVARRACATSEPLTQEEDDLFIRGYDTLQQNKTPQDGRPTLPGYEPSTALEGLSGCEYAMLHSFVYSHYHDLEGLNNHRVQVYAQYHPAPAPIYNGPEQPERRGSGKSGLCEDYGNRYCPH